MSQPSIAKNELENHLTKTLLKSPRGQWLNLYYDDWIVLCSIFTELSFIHHYFIYTCIYVTGMCIVFSHGLCMYIKWHDHDDHSHIFLWILTTHVSTCSWLSVVQGWGEYSTYEYWKISTRVVLEYNVFSIFMFIILGKTSTRVVLAPALQWLISWCFWYCDHFKILVSFITCTVMMY